MGCLTAFLTRLSGKGLVERVDFLRSEAVDTRAARTNPNFTLKGYVSSGSRDQGGNEMSQRPVAGRTAGVQLAGVQ
jgi:hypothetical protein